MLAAVILTGGTALNLSHGLSGEIFPADFLQLKEPKQISK